MIYWSEGLGEFTLGFHGLGFVAGYLIAGSVGAWTGIVLAAVATFIVGWLMNREWGWDAEHTLYGIPMQYWGIPGISFAAVHFIVRPLAA